MTFVEFVQPAWLSLLILGPLAGMAYWRFVSRSTLPGAFCLGLVVATLVAMCAQPRLATYTSVEKYEHRDIIGLLDESGSTSLCVDPQRHYPCVDWFTAMRNGLAEFAWMRPTDTVAVTAFDDRVRVVTSLKQDTMESISALQNLSAEFALTDTLKALRSAIEQFRAKPSDHRVLILLSDGDDIVDGPEAQSLFAQLGELKVAIYFIAIRPDSPMGTVTRAFVERTGGTVLSAKSAFDLRLAFVTINMSERAVAYKDWVRAEVPLASSCAVLLVIFAFLLLFSIIKDGERG